MNGSSPPDWPAADKAYQHHHAACPQCRAAGTSPNTQQRCPEGAQLWGTYHKAALKAEQTGNREFGAQVRAMYLRDMRSRAADLAGDIGEATKLLQHSSQRLAERHSRTKAEKLRAVR